MLTILETLIITAIIPVLVWPLLPVKRVPRFLDFSPLASVIFLVLHLFIDNEAVRLRFIPLYIYIISGFLFSIKRVFHHNPEQSNSRILAGTGRILALILLVFCVMLPTLILPFNSLPEPSGSYDVGIVTADFIDESRLETLSKEANGHRELAVQFWYPVDRTETKLRYDLKNSPISNSQDTYPVLIFSHGAFGMRLSNASAFRELASHGYIVASIDHTYHSFFTSFSDGRGVPVNIDFLNEAIGASNGDLSKDKTFEITHGWLDLRVADIELIIDSLKAGKLSNEAAILKNHMDLNNIGLFGHSLGGATAAQVLRMRDDVKAAIVIDGTMIGDIIGLDEEDNDILSTESYNKPLMLMYNTSFQDSEAVASSYLPNINAFNSSTSYAYSLYIKDSGHLNFTDLPRISPFLSNMLGVGTVDSYDSIKIVNDYCLAFFNKHIKDEPSALLDGSATPKTVGFDKITPGDNMVNNRN